MKESAVEKHEWGHYLPAGKDSAAGEAGNNSQAAGVEQAAGGDEAHGCVVAARGCAPHACAHGGAVEEARAAPLPSEDSTNEGSSQLVRIYSTAVGFYLDPTVDFCIPPDGVSCTDLPPPLLSCSRPRNHSPGRSHSPRNLLRSPARLVPSG